MSSTWWVRHWRLGYDFWIIYALVGSRAPRIWNFIHRCSLLPVEIRTIGRELIVIFILYFFCSLFLYEIGTMAKCSRYESAPDMKLYFFLLFFYCSNFLYLPDIINTKSLLQYNCCSLVACSSLILFFLHWSYCFYTYFSYTNGQYTCPYSSVSKGK